MLARSIALLSEAKSSWSRQLQLLRQCLTANRSLDGIAAAHITASLKGGQLELRNLCKSFMPSASPFLDIFFTQCVVAAAPGYFVGPYSVGTVL